MTPDVRDGRRAAVWYGFCRTRKRTPYGPAGPAADHPDWTARLSVHRTKWYGTASARAHPLKKIHIVRDQIVATNGELEVRWTHWLCGADTFAASLTSAKPKLVCSACLLVAQRRSVERFP